VAGDVVNLVRSPAGFHILKVVEKINLALPSAFVTQNHVRHILLRPTANMSDAAARTRLAGFKKLILSGRADFSRLARDYSHDGSAAKGGDLGWSSPGMLVPEFESALETLSPSAISDPIASRFGMHLVQLLERRQSAVSPTQQREAIRAMVRENKLDEAYRIWVQTQRARAYVEMREAPER